MYQVARCPMLVSVLNTSPSHLRENVGIQIVLLLQLVKEVLCIPLNIQSSLFVARLIPQLECRKLSNCLFLHT